MVVPSECEEPRERNRFPESVAVGLADAEAGRVVDSEDIKSLLMSLNDAVKGSA